MTVMESIKSAANQTKEALQDAGETAKPFLENAKEALGNAAK